jgi:hypothetical protein
LRATATRLGPTVLLALSACAAAPRAGPVGTAPPPPREVAFERTYHAVLGALAENGTIVYRDMGRGLVLAAAPRKEPPPLCGTREPRPVACERRAIHVHLEPCGEACRAEVHVFVEEPADDDAPVSPSEPRLSWRITGEDELLATLIERGIAARLGGRTSAARAPRESLPARRAADDEECQARPEGIIISPSRPTRKPRREPPVGVSDLEAIGARYLDEGRYAMAAAALGAAGDLEPQAPFTPFLLAHAEIARGRAAAAAEALARGLDANPDWLSERPAAPLPPGLARERARLAQAAPGREERLVLAYLLLLERDWARARDLLGALHAARPEDPHVLLLYRLAAVRACEAAGLRAH